MGSMAEQEEADLNAGRTRLADLNDDHYEYGGKRGRKKKGRRKSKGTGGNNKPIQNEERGEDESSDIDGRSNMDQHVTFTDEDGVNQDEDEKIEGENSNINEANSDTTGDDICTALNSFHTDISIESSEDEEPDSWRCVCCRKDFKSLKQFENHERSKKHKEPLKKYNKKQKEETKVKALGD